MAVCFVHVLLRPRPPLVCPTSLFPVTGDVFVRIAQVAPLAEAVPPKFYGGTERVVSWITEELVRQGHDLSLIHI